VGKKRASYGFFFFSGKKVQGGGCSSVGNFRTNHFPSVHLRIIDNFFFYSAHASDGKAPLNNVLPMRKFRD